MAGGLNAYGFAGGDPVNFGDAFGLTPDDCKGFWSCLAEFGQMTGQGFAAGADIEQYVAVHEYGGHVSPPG